MMKKIKRRENTLVNKFPFVNLNTGKIYNCRKGSLEWLHEKGHIEFDRLESTAKSKLFQNYIFWFWMLSMTLTAINHYMLIISIPAFVIYIWIEIYEERWCNTYANARFKKMD